MVLALDSLLTKYQSILKTNMSTLTLTPDEILKYFYKPKVLSFDLYGTTELWFLLLHANELTSFNQFTLNPLKTYSPNVMNQIKIILNLEKTTIDMNEEAVYNALKDT